MTARLEELIQLAHILGVDLSENPDVQRIYDEEHAEYAGTGMRQVYDDGDNYTGPTFMEFDD